MTKLALILLIISLTCGCGPTQVTSVPEYTVLGQASPLSTRTAPESTLPAAPCAAMDLKGDISTDNYAEDKILFIMRIRNNSNAPCFLQNPPDVHLVDASGHALDIRYELVCWLSADEGPKNCRELLHSKIILRSGDQVRSVLLWRNWCKQSSMQSLWVRLTLSSSLGQVDLPSDIDVGAKCIAPDSKSYISVTQFDYSPLY